MSFKIAMQKPAVHIALICLLVSATVHAGGDPSGEWSVIGSYDTGSYGLESDSENRELMLRYTTGNAFQFRFELSTLSTELAAGMLPTSLGPTRGGHGEGGSGSGQSGDDTGGSSSAMLAFDPDGQGKDVFSSSGVGDLRLAVSRRLSGGGVKLFRVDTELEVKVPTADEDKGLGTGKTDYRFGVAGEYGFWSATGFAGLGWNILGDPDGYDLADVVDAYIGVESEPVAGGRVVLSGWLEGNDETVEGAGRRLAAGIGLRTTGKVRWDIRLGAGLGGASEDLRVSVGLSFGILGNGFRQRGITR